MKKFFICLSMIIAFFSLPAVALNQTDFGWKVLNDANGKKIGISNTGEQGGFLVLSCNDETHKLKMTYSFNGKMYDMFVFRKFGVVDLNQTGNAGKFVVGAGMVSEQEVYWNLRTADTAFTIARMPVGSKAKFDHAILTNSPNGPDIQQEGDENFIVGKGDMKVLLWGLSEHCPLDLEDKLPIF